MMSCGSAAVITRQIADPKAKEHADLVGTNQKSVFDPTLHSGARWTEPYAH